MSNELIIYLVSYGLVLRTYATAAYPLGGLVGVTHWRYAESTPDPSERESLVPVPIGDLDETIDAAIKENHAD